MMAGVYVGICFGAYLIQNRFLYKPYRKPADLDLARQTFSAISKVSYETENGLERFGFFIPPKGKKKVIAFMHGNACHAGCFLPWIHPFVKAGYGALMIEYTGFGGIEGDLSQKNIEQDVTAGIKYLNNNGFKNKDIILYGYSLGTYFAVYAAASLGQTDPFDAVILEAPFTSVRDVAAVTVSHLLPVSLLLKDTYNSLAYVPHVNTRVFVAHGKQDARVPYEQGKRVFEKAADPKIFFSSDKATHTDLRRHGFPETVLQWL